MPESLNIPPLGWGRLSMQPESTMRNVLLSVVFIAALAPSYAGATCPTGYTDCDGGAAAVICTQAGNGDITCNLGANGGTSASSAKAYTNSGGDFEAWGTDSDGNDFCCNFDMECQDVVTINGTDYVDVIDLNGAATSLDCVTDFVFGSGAADDITGSDGTAVDNLNGEAGNDTVNGLSGPDNIDGGSSNDTLYGGTGNDTIHAGTGDDYVYAGIGNDTVYAEDGYDHVKGESGDDYVDGGANDDNICGGFDGDDLYGGTGNDKVDGGPQLDSIDGGANTNTCSAHGIDSMTNCADYLYTCDW